MCIIVVLHITLSAVDHSIISRVYCGLEQVLIKKGDKPIQDRMRKYHTISHQQVAPPFQDRYSAIAMLIFCRRLYCNNNELNIMYCNKDVGVSPSYRAIFMRLLLYHVGRCTSQTPVINHPRYRRPNDRARRI